MISFALILRFCAKSCPALLSKFSLSSIVNSVPASIRPCWLVSCSPRIFRLCSLCICPPRLLSVDIFKSNNCLALSNPCSLVSCSLVIASIWLTILPLWLFNSVAFICKSCCDNNTPSLFIKVCVLIFKFFSAVISPCSLFSVSVRFNENLSAPKCTIWPFSLLNTWLLRVMLSLLNCSKPLLLFICCATTNGEFCWSFVCWVNNKLPLLCKLLAVNVVLACVSIVPVLVKLSVFICNCPCANQSPWLIILSSALISLMPSVINKPLLKATESPASWKLPCWPYW